MFAFFPVPGLTYFIVTMSFMMANFPKAFIFSALASWSGSQFSFFFVRYIFKNILKDKIRKNRLFRALQDEVKEHPWKASTMISVVIIPAALKNYMLALSDVTWLQFGVPSFPFYCLFSFMLCLVGTQIKDVKKLSSEGLAGFDNMSRAELIRFIFSWILIIVSIFVFCFVGAVAKRRLAEISKNEKEKR